MFGADFKSRSAADLEYNGLSKPKFYVRVAKRMASQEQYMNW